MHSPTSFEEPLAPVSTRAPTPIPEVPPPDEWPLPPPSWDDRSPSPIDYHRADLWSNVAPVDTSTQTEPSPSPTPPTSPRPPTCRPLPVPAPVLAPRPEQENLPPFQYTFPAPCPYDHPQHPHQFIGVQTQRATELFPPHEISLGRPLDILTVDQLTQNLPVFPGIIPFRGPAVHTCQVNPKNESVASALGIPPVRICARATRYYPTDHLPLGCIKYSFTHDIVHLFRPAPQPVKAAFSGFLVALQVYDFLDGRVVSFFRYLDFGPREVYVRSVGLHNEDHARTRPQLLQYCFVPRIPIDPLVYCPVHPEDLPLVAE